MDEAGSAVRRGGVPSRVGTEMAEGFFKLIDELMTVLKAGTGAVLRKLDDLVKAIKKWFDELITGKRIDKNNIDDIISKYPTGFISKGNSALSLSLKRSMVQIEKQANDPNLIRKFQNAFKRKRRNITEEAYLLRRKTLYVNSHKGTKAEELFLALFGGVKRAKAIRTSITRRYIDNVKDGIGKEVKSGFVKNTKAVRTQIEKDIKIVNEKIATDVIQIEWHFLNGVDDKVLDFVIDYCKEKAIDPRLIKIIIY